MNIPLHGVRAAGRAALIDDEDYELVSGYNWWIYLHRTSGFYARGSLIGAGRGARQIWMHNLIMGATGIDHADHNGLNNQRANLRPAGKSQNAMNQLPQSGTSSQFKGVTWFRPQEKWMTRIKMNQKSIFLGYYDDEEDAARAYNIKASELFGDFACLNEVTM